jgi:hypothetical protein
MNPATKTLNEIKEAMKLQNRTKKALSPVTKEDFDLCEGGENGK